MPLPYRALLVAFQVNDPVGPRINHVTRLNFLALTGYGLVVALPTLSPLLSRSGGPRLASPWVAGPSAAGIAPALCRQLFAAHH